MKKQLKRFSLDVAFEAGEEVFAILGASGCGKSMTLKCIAGIETPDEGRIVLNGRVLFDSAQKINLPPQKRRVGYMFQDYALFPNMTVRQNVMAGMGKNPDAGKVDEYLSRFHVMDLQEHYPEQLSGGQKQRVAMARIIAQEPEAILLDEPFAALDSYLKWELEQEMQMTLSRLNKTTLFVSHNRDEVYRLSQTVSCINQGKMEVVEPVREFFQNPKTRTAAILSGCKNISAAEVLDTHHILAKDWNLTLTVEREIPKEVTSVGIRAHYFSTEETGCDNCFPVTGARLLEDPFEWNLSFRTDKDSAFLQWKLPKTPGQRVEVPEKLYLNSCHILLLQECRRQKKPSKR
jgi:molybdate transport system ATP-binding protein